jgi:hypothetical protein
MVASEGTSWQIVLLIDARVNEVPTSRDGFVTLRKRDVRRTSAGVNARDDVFLFLAVGDESLASFVVREILLVGVSDLRAVGCVREREEEKEEEEEEGVRKV